MPNKPKTHRPKHQPTRKQQNAAYDARRAEDAIRKLYWSPRWRRGVRVLILARDPYCKRCEAKGIITPSDTVNHIVKARDDPSRFFDEDNLEGVCAPCHSREIQIEERKAVNAKD